MKACRTGVSRLRAGVPQDWTVGDKPATAQMVRPTMLRSCGRPQRVPILVAAYLSGSQASLDKINAAHVKLANIVKRSVWLISFLRRLFSSCVGRSCCGD